jgi:hypothetical protein
MTYVYEIAMLSVLCMIVTQFRLVKELMDFYQIWYERYAFIDLRNLEPFNFPKPHFYSG